MVSFVVVEPKAYAKQGLCQSQPQSLHLGFSFLSVNGILSMVRRSTRDEQPTRGILCCGSLTLLGRDALSDHLG